MFFGGCESAFLTVHYQTGYDTSVWDQNKYETHGSTEQTRVDARLWNRGMKSKYETKYESVHETNVGLRLSKNTFFQD